MSKRKNIRVAQGLVPFNQHTPTHLTHVVCVSTKGSLGGRYLGGTFLVVEIAQDRGEVVYLLDEEWQEYICVTIKDFQTQFMTLEPFNSMSQMG